jgi:hypothetical protein
MKTALGDDKVSSKVDQEGDNYIMSLDKTLGVNMLKHKGQVSWWHLFRQPHKNLLLSRRSKTSKKQGWWLLMTGAGDVQLYDRQNTKM